MGYLYCIFALEITKSKAFMKKLLFLCSVALALTSCYSGNNSKPVIPSIDDEVVTDSTSAEVQNHADPVLIEERVKLIYEAVARCYPEIHDLSPTTDSLDMAFCSTQWQTLVGMVNEKDASSMGGTGFFDTDYWIQGQDWGKIGISNVKVKVKDDSHADINLDLHNITTKKVKLQMIFERGEWMIDNFIDETNKVNWKQNMTKYLEEKKEEKQSKLDQEIIEYEIP